MSVSWGGSLAHNCNQCNVVSMNSPQNYGHPLISVITASFNALNGLRQTVDSVAQQQDTMVEHVVIDGGSTDGTPAYLKSLGEKVRWISEPDDGIASALNKGVAMAQGEYILVLQAEDTFASSSSVCDAWGELSGKDDIVAFEVDLVMENGERRRRKSRNFGWLTEFKMTNPHQGMLCRRDLFARIGGFDESFGIAMDYEWLLRAKRAGATLRAIPEVLAVMPATGVSTQLDWESTEIRLDEDRRLQALHAKGDFGRAVNRAFWAIYKPFKRIKAGTFKQ